MSIPGQGVPHSPHSQDPQRPRASERGGGAQGPRGPRRSGPAGPHLGRGVAVAALLIVLTAALGFGSSHRGGARLAPAAPAAPTAPATPHEAPLTIAASVAPGGAPLTAAALKSAALAGIKPGIWFDPPTVRPGERPYDLEVKKAPNVVRAADGSEQRVNLRSYNGMLVGPTFRVRPNDTLKVNLVNRLATACSPAPAGAGMSGMAMSLDATNLHTHGMHISPSGKSDNVLREVQPGCTADYSFAILPAGTPRGEPAMTHYPGSHWYHAHLHGATAVQLASGMAGALIVEGDIDAIPEIRAARERTFVFQQLAFDKSGEVKALADLTNNWNGKVPEVNGPKKHTTVNGQTKPLIELRPEQVERWRLIDAGIFEVLDLSLRNEANAAEVIPLHEIALDGITLKAVKQVDGLELAPGYRADVLVKAPRSAGTYLLYKARPAVQLTALTAGGPLPAAADEPQILAVVHVAGEPCTSVRNPCASRLLPDGTRLPAPLRDIARSEVTAPERHATFNVVNGKFLINDRTFDPDHVHADFQLKKGTVEEWVLANDSGGAHPFHIHVNAFQMVNDDGTPGEWRDTILVQPGDKLRMRTRIETFTGRFVLHCHILTHEDLGMMQLVEVSP